MGCERSIRTFLSSRVETTEEVAQVIDVKIFDSVPHVFEGVAQRFLKVVPVTSDRVPYLVEIQIEIEIIKPSDDVSDGRDSAVFQGENKPHRSFLPGIKGK